MSQSPIASDKSTAAQYFKNWDALGLMIARGHSFSGQERNCVFLNIGSKQFADASAVALLDFPDDGRAIALTDWDHDGDLDVWLANRNAPQVRMMRNDLGQGNPAVAIQLRGVGSNRDGIGARVQVELREGEQVRQLVETVRAGSGFLSQSTKWLHFGMLPSQEVERVRVRWPGRSTWQDVAGIQPGHRYLIRQDVESAQQMDVRDGTLVLQPGEPSTPESPGSARVTFSKRPQMPTLQAEGMRGQQLVITPDEDASATLVTLWASWCNPCLVELGQLTDHYPRIKEAGVRIIALSADSIQPSAGTTIAESKMRARQLNDQLQMPFTAGFAPPELLQQLGEAKSRALYKERPLPLPCSFLLDRDGRWAAFYSGPTDVRQLLDDVALLDATLEERDAVTFPAPGRFVFRSTGVNPISLVDAYLEGEYFADARRELREMLGRVSGDLGALPEEKRLAISKTRLEIYRRLISAEVGTGEMQSAERICRDALTMADDPTPFRLELAQVLVRRGQLDSAEAEFAKVVQAMHDKQQAHLAVGTRWIELGFPARAADSLKQALQTGPDSPAIRFGLASALMKAKSSDESIDYYRSIADSAQAGAWAARAANNLAWFWATTAEKRDRNGEQAVRYAKRACEVTEYANPMYLGTLGSALAETGDFEQAISLTDQALVLAEQQPALRRSLRSRRKLYRSGRPFHMTPTDE